LMVARPVAYSSGLGLGLSIAAGAGVRGAVGALSGFVVVFPVLPSPLLAPLSLQLLGDFVFHRVLKECGEAFAEFVGWGRRSARVRFAVAMTCGSDEFVWNLAGGAERGGWNL
jgi:hypothetical protein